MTKRRILIPMIVILIVVVGAIMLIASPQELPLIELEMREFGYNDSSGGPVLYARVGETLKINLFNAGVIEHEFMVVNNKDMSLKMMKNRINDLQATNLSEEKQIENFHNMHHKMMVDMLSFSGSSIELLPGETRTIEIVVDRPGTFWYVCHQASSTFPELHQDKGMFGKIIVE